MLSVVVADDELTIRRGIIELTDWENQGCAIVAEFSNGQEVLDFLQTNLVDIVITDIRMPRLDGLSLSKEIQQKHPEIAVIILTAYSDFNYAKKAIHYGVSDFIIKNNFIEELPNVLKHIVDKSQNKTGTVFPKRIIELQLRSLLTSEKNLEDLVELNSFYQKYFYRVCFCELIINHQSDSFHEEMRDKFFNLFHIACEGMNIANIEEPEDCIMVLSTPDKLKILDRNMSKICKSFINLCSNLMPAMIKVGISSCFDSLTDIQKACAESKITLENLIAESNECSLYEKEAILPGNSVNIHEYKEKICHHLISEGTKDAESEFLKLQGQMKIARQPLAQSKMQILEILSYIMGSVNNRYKGINVNSLEVGLFMDVSKTQTLFSLFQAGLKTLVEIGNLIHQQRKNQNGTINRVTDYIYINYMRKIHLNEISRDLGISGGYLSRLYKRETGQNLTDMINIMKIDKAKILLEDKKEYKIYEIAEMVGIPDAGYFSKVFKKYNNETPLEFRNHNKKTK
ncbi:MAG: response regulator [Spirochaetales bacterium]|nr:response regulator [Spirochaetales bacterium]